MPGWMLLLALPLPDAVVPDGTKLQEGSSCYTLTRGDKPIGQTWQRVRAANEGGVPVWDVIVHQRVGDGRFDMRDHFVLRRADLRPLSMDSRRNGAEHVRVRYDGSAIETTKAGQTPTRITAPGAVWDGNLWGLTFAALPLAEGGSYELPYYQYDKGLGRFLLKVVGTAEVAGRAAWIVEADAGDGRTVRYQIGKKPAEELGTESPMFGQRLGGDCSALVEP
ncbi:hypothetical protein [Sphingomonas elodea]|uniref:DUF3108 domain-containing protein n=1 Tax=Sphingomonas elodea TaxID=179878 RepID=UPI0002631AA7|nr:hypothetical protein [Sphingomonas elodea]